MTQTRRPRHSTAGGYARGDETRQRIITAAIQLFGDHGFDKASTRDIATAAGVNAPALQYYFENKEGLYKACAEYILEDVKTRFSPTMKLAADALKNGDTDALIDAYLGMQSVTLESVLTQSHASKGRMIGREMAGEVPNLASKMLQRRMKQPLNKLQLSLLAGITGKGPNDPITRIRLLTLKGQVLSFYYPPGACLDLLGWKEIDAAKAALIKTTVQEQTRTLLESWRNAAEKSS